MSGDRSPRIGQNVMDREERVLTLLHLLGPEAAEQVLDCLDAPLNDTLRSRLQGFEGELPPVRRQQQILEEFERFFRFTLASGPRSKGGLKLHAPTAEEPDFEDDAPPQPQYRPSGDPLIDLERMNMYQLAGALEEEQARTVALLLKVVTPKRVAQILALLPEEKQEQIVREMSRDPRAPEIILRRIATTTVERALTLPAQPRKKEDPVQRMVDVLRATDKPKRRQILKALEEQNPEQASEINSQLYQFEDLASLADEQIQKVLARIDSTSLSTALFGADEEIVSKIMGNLSKRARGALQEELSFRRNVSASDLKAARILVVQAIAEAEQESD